MATPSTPATSTPRTITLRLVDTRDPESRTRRLRAAAKSLLRAHGWRIEHIATTSEEAADDLTDAMTRQRFEREVAASREGRVPR